MTDYGLPTIDRRRGLAIAAAALAVIIAGAFALLPNNETSTEALFGEWVAVSDLQQIAGLQDIPPEVELTLVLRATNGSADFASITLGCSDYGGGATDLPSLEIPEPTIAGEECNPRIAAGEEFLSETIFSSGKAELVGDRLIVTTRSFEIEFKRRES